MWFQLFRDRLGLSILDRPLHCTAPVAAAMVVHPGSALYNWPQSHLALISNGLAPWNLEVEATAPGAGYRAPAPFEVSVQISEHFLPPFHVCTPPFHTRADGNGCVSASEAARFRFNTFRPIIMHRGF